MKVTTQNIPKVNSHHFIRENGEESFFFPSKKNRETFFDASAIQPKLTIGQLTPTIQRDEEDPREFQLAGGRVVVNRFEVENSPWGENRARQTGWLELQFVPSEGSRFASPGSINWLQTVRTNSRGGSEPVPPEEEYPSSPPTQFVDGYLERGPNNQQGQFWRPPSFTFQDLPARDNLPDRDTTWQAETSCIGITAQGFERLITFTWGFTIDRNGRGTEIPLTTVATPSAYHMQKFRELPRPEQGE